MKPRAIKLPNGMTVFGLNEIDTLLVYKEIFEEKGYARQGLEYRDGDVILDVGANTGLFAVYLNQICPRVKYFAFEPIPAVFDVLRQNVERQTQLCAELFNVGISCQAGEARFSYYPRLSCASSMYPDNSDGEVRRGRQYILDQMRQKVGVLGKPLQLVPRSIQELVAECARRFYRREVFVVCTLRTISDIILEYELDRIDLLKIDAERAEVQILDGIDLEHWPRIRQAVVEVHAEADLSSVAELLQAHGFHVNVERHLAFDHIFMVYAIRR